MLLQSRKSVKPHADLVVQIKTLWETIRQKKTNDNKKKNKKKIDKDNNAKNPDETMKEKENDQEEDQTGSNEDNEDDKNDENGTKNNEDNNKNKQITMDKTELVGQLISLVTGKIHELIFRHDASRIIQTCVKYGTKEQRQIIFDELKDSLLELSKSQYGHFLMIKMLHYASKTQVPALLAPFKGHLPALLRHKEASTVIEYAYREIATNQQKDEFIQEFYGPQFSLFNDDAQTTNKPLSDNNKSNNKSNNKTNNMVVKWGARRGAICENLRKTLDVLITKQLLHHSISHRLLRDYFTYGEEKQVLEMGSAIRDQLIDMVSSADGSHVVIHMLTYGVAKDKKTIVKSLKEKGLMGVAKDEYGHVVVIAALHNVDDTVFLHKALLIELLNGIGTLMGDKYGGRIFLYLIAPLLPRYFPPNIMSLINQNPTTNPSSPSSSASSSSSFSSEDCLPTVFQRTGKKDFEQKRKELLVHCIDPIVEFVKNNMFFMLSNYQPSLFLLEFLKSEYCKNQNEIFETIGQLIADENTTSNILEHPVGHRSIKRILHELDEQQKQNQTDNHIEAEHNEKNNGLGKIIFEQIENDLLRWCLHPSASFVVAAVLQYADPSTRALLKEKLMRTKKNFKTQPDTKSGLSLILKLIQDGNGTPPKHGSKKT